MKEMITDAWLMLRCFEKKVINENQSVYYFDAAKRFYLILNFENNISKQKCRINTVTHNDWITDVRDTDELLTLYKCLTGCELSIKATVKDK
jgi:hypothetical protein